MVLAETNSADIGWTRWIVLGSAIIECLFFAGLLYGWPSLNFVLKSEDIYADLCADSSNRSLSTENRNDSEMFNVVFLNATTYSGNSLASASSKMSAMKEACTQQDDKMALCFTIGSVMFCIGCAVMGRINLKFGTRFTRLVSCALFVSGTLMMAFTSKEHPWLMFPGLSLISIGGMPIFMTNTQVSNLFPTRSSSVVGVLCGAFDTSSGVMLIVKTAHEEGFDRMYMFIILAVVHLLTLGSTFFFLPKGFIPRPDNNSDEDEAGKVRHDNSNRGDSAEDEAGIVYHENSNEGDSAVDEAGIVHHENSNQGDSADDEAGVVHLENSNQGGEETDTNTELPKLKSCLLQPKYITHVFWLCILQLRLFYYLGTLNPYLNRLLDEDEEKVSKWTNICQFIMVGGIISSPLAGLSYDLLKQKFAGDKKPAAVPLAVASGLSVLLSILVLIPALEILCLSFIVLTVYRSYLYSIAAGFISTIFPSEYFGILFGIMMLVGGIVNILFYPLSYWSECSSKSPQYVNICLLVLVLSSFIHPLYLYLKCCQEEKNVDGQPEQKAMIRN